MALHDGHIGCIVFCPYPYNTEFHKHRAVQSAKMNYQFSEEEKNTVSSMGKETKLPLQRKRSRWENPGYVLCMSICMRVCLYVKRIF